MLDRVIEYETLSSKDKPSREPHLHRHDGGLRRHPFFGIRPSALQLFVFDVARPAYLRRGVLVLQEALYPPIPYIRLRHRHRHHGLGFHEYPLLSIPLFARRIPIWLLMETEGPFIDQHIHHVLIIVLPLLCIDDLNTPIPRRGEYDRCPIGLN